MLQELWARRSCSKSSVLMQGNYGVFTAVLRRSLRTWKIGSVCLGNLKSVVRDNESVEIVVGGF